MKLEKIDWILLILLAVFTIIYIFNLIPLNVYAAEASEEITSEQEEEPEEPDLNNLYEIISEHKTTVQSESDETQVTLTEIKTLLTNLLTNSQSQIELASWILALLAFQTALTIVLVFAMGWGR